MGKVRIKELEASCRRLGILHLKQLDDPQLPDSMKQFWSHQLITDYVKEYISAHRIETVITFDGYGVSGHANHISIYLAMKRAKENADITIPIYALQSVSVLRKFTFFLDALWKRGSVVFLASPSGYMQGRAAMFQHASQLVWFRHLYLLFSRYMVVNDLQLV